MLEGIIRVGAEVRFLSNDPEGDVLVHATFGNGLAISWSSSSKSIAPASASRAGDLARSVSGGRPMPARSLSCGPLFLRRKY